MLVPALTETETSVNDEDIRTTLSRHVDASLCIRWSMVSFYYQTHVKIPVLMILLIAKTFWRGFSCNIKAVVSVGISRGVLSGDDSCQHTWFIFVSYCKTRFSTFITKLLIAVLSLRFLTWHCIRRHSSEQVLWLVSTYRWFITDAGNKKNY